MHQIHNNENDYPWQKTVLTCTKKVLSNTGSRRLNIIGAVNPVIFEPTIMLTEENCCAEVIEAFVEEIKQRYYQSTSLSIILDNAIYQHSYLVQNKAKTLAIDLIPNCIYKVVQHIQV